MTKRRRLGLALGCVCALVVVAEGCGTSCPEIRQQRADFDLRKRQSRGPDAALTLPFALLDRVIAGQLARRAPVPIALPTDKLGIALSLSLSLDRVTTHAAPDGRLGMTLHLAVVDGRSRVLELEVDTSIAPLLSTPAGQPPELAMTLRPQDLGAVRPHATPEGARLFGRWLRDNLPPIARALATDEVVQALTQQCLELLADNVWPHARDHLLGQDALVDTRFALPDLPIRDLALTSSEAALQAQITTDLPEAQPLGRDVARTSERLTLRLSGGTAIGLVNRAMERGEVPSHFDAHGKPAADGMWEARLGWRGGSSPLVVHLWRMRGGCESADVAAQLALALEGDKVRVEVRDGRFTSVAGPAFAEAVAWLGSLFGSALSATFDAPSFVRFEAGKDQVQLRLARIALDERDLTLDLDLGVAPR